MQYTLQNRTFFIQFFPFKDISYGFPWRVGARVRLGHGDLVYNTAAGMTDDFHKAEEIQNTQQRRSLANNWVEYMQEERWTVSWLWSARRRWWRGIITTIIDNWQAFITTPASVLVPLTSSDLRLTSTTIAARCGHCWRRLWFAVAVSVDVRKPLENFRCDVEAEQLIFDTRPATTCTIITVTLLIALDARHSRRPLDCFLPEISFCTLWTCDIDLWPNVNLWHWPLT